MSDFQKLFRTLFFKVTPQKGLNYSDHCTEQNKPIPKEPVIFNKFPSSIIADGEKIELPKIGCNTDLEAELAVIIGKSGKHISKVQNRSF